MKKLWSGFLILFKNIFDSFELGGNKRVDKNTAVSFSLKFWWVYDLMKAYCVIGGLWFVIQRQSDLHETYKRNRSVVFL
jgi:hypothetical protein